MQLFWGVNRLMCGVQAPREDATMRNEETGRETRRLLARMKRQAETEASEESRDEAQRVLLARHLQRLRGKSRGGA